MFSAITLRLRTLCVGFLLFAALAWAAEGGMGEIVGFGGVARVSDGGGTHAMTGGAAGVNLGSVIHAFGEFNYIPLGSASATTWYASTPIHASATAKMLNFGG